MTDGIRRIGLAAILGLATVAVTAGEGTAKESSRSPILTAAASRGELLYENHCTGCHDSTVHIRANRKAKSITDLRGWAARWAGELKLNWSSDDIDDVAEYLARRYYKCDEKADKC